MPKSRDRIRTHVALGLMAIALSGVSLRAQRVAVPTPESVFGHAVGADFKLIGYDESIRYFERLANTSNRIKLIEVGRTSNGKPWTLALISSPANLTNLERLRTVARRLAHPAGLSDHEARALAREGRTFVDISGGLHASEIAGSQHTIQLAYDLLTRDDEKTQAILANTVLLLWPSINPDGQDIVVNWYRRNVGTPFEISPLDELYQKYIGHDNNRDAYMLNVIESRVVARTWRHWEPQIIYVHHQTAPFPGISYLNYKQRDLRELADFLAAGLVKGLKLYPGYEPFYPHDPRLRVVYQLAEEFGVPVMIHSGDTFSPNGKVKYSHPLQVDEVAVDHRNLNFVICHLGNPWLVDCLEVVYKNANVYADFSGLVLGDFTEAFEDWPICSMKSYLDFVGQLKLSDADRHAIMYENARKLFKLDHLPAKVLPPGDPSPKTSTRR